MRWKIACIILLFVILALAFSWLSAYFHMRELESVIDKYTEEDLQRKNFVPGTFETPRIPDAPPGTKPVFTAKGSVRYAPTKGASTPISDAPRQDTAGARPTTQDAPAASQVLPVPCSLDDLDVTVRCLVDGLATPTKPWVKLTTSGTISAWGQTRELPPTPAGDVKMQMSAAVVPPRWHLDLLGGVAAGGRLGAEFGAAWTGRRRTGGYALVEWQPATGGLAYVPSAESYLDTGQPATWRGHAGVRFRVK